MFMSLSMYELHKSLWKFTAFSLSLSVKCITNHLLRLNDCFKLSSTKFYFFLFDDQSLIHLNINSDSTFHLCVHIVHFRCCNPVTFTSTRGFVVVAVTFSMFNINCSCHKQKTDIHYTSYCVSRILYCIH